MKLCCDCKEIISNPGPRSLRCKPCAVLRTFDQNQKFYAANREREKLRAKEWRAKNPNIVKDVTKAWRTANKDRHAAMKKAWNFANKERLTAKRKEKYAANRERELENMRKYKLEHKEELRLKRSKYLKENPETNRYFRSLRRAAEKRATPSWANKKKIRSIYAEASRLTIETGVEHHVDHIYPLKSKVMCGLHVETNLQILTHTENHKKSNRHWPAQPIEMRV